MANTKSAKKATRKIARRTEINQQRRSRARTFIKRVESAIQAGDKTKAQEALRLADKEGQRAAGKGVFHAKTIARKISRLSKKIAGLA